MTREQHIAISKWARMNALRNLTVNGNLTLIKGSKSVQSSINEALK